MSSTVSSDGGLQSSGESSRSSSPRVHRIGKQSNSRASRSEYAAFKALLRGPLAQLQHFRIRSKSRSVSRRPSTIAPSPIDSDSDSESDDSSATRQEDSRWPNKSHLDLTVEPRLDELIKSYAGEYIRRKGLNLRTETDIEEGTVRDNAPAGQEDQGADPEILSTLSSNVINKLNRTLVNLAVGYRGHRGSNGALTGYDVLGAYNLTTVPGTNTLIDELAGVVNEDKLKLHAHRLNVVRDALKARPLAPRAAFYAPLKPRQSRDTAKYYERARKRNKRAKTATG